MRAQLNEERRSLRSSCIEWLVVVVILGLFVFLAADDMRYPMPHFDDVEVIQWGEKLCQEGLLHKFFTRWSPLAEYYNGNVEGVLWQPFVRYFQDVIKASRVGSIFYSFLGFIFFYLAARELCGRRWALVVLALLAFEPNMLFAIAANGLYTGVAGLFLPSMVLLYCLVRWKRTAQPWYLWGVAFCVGYGVSVKVWFAWLAIALMIMEKCGVEIYRTIQRAQGSLVKTVGGAVIALCVGGYPMIQHEVLTGKMWIVRDVLLLVTDPGKGNSAYFDNLLKSIGTFISYVLPCVMICPGDVAVAAVTSVNKYVWLCAYGCCGFYYVVAWLRKNACAVKDESYLWFLVVIMLALTPITCHEPVRHHLLFLYPFMVMSVGLACRHLIRLATGRSQRFVRAALTIGLSVLIVANIGSIVHVNQIKKEQHGAGQYNTDVWNEVFAWLGRSAGAVDVCIFDPFWCPDSTMYLVRERTGVDVNIVCCWYAQNIPQVLRYRQEKYAGKNVIFLMAQDGYEILVDALPNTGCTIVDEKHFFDPGDRHVMAATVIAVPGDV